MLARRLVLLCSDQVAVLLDVYPSDNSRNWNCIAGAQPFAHSPNADPNRHHPFLALSYGLHEVYASQLILACLQRLDKNLQDYLLGLSSSLLTQNESGV
jgi:hypothetical protein